jgi:hypothetical protein
MLRMSLTVVPASGVKILSLDLGLDALNSSGQRWQMVCVCAKTRPLQKICISKSFAFLKQSNYYKCKNVDEGVTVLALQLFILFIYSPN